MFLIIDCSYKIDCKMVLIGNYTCSWSINEKSLAKHACDFSLILLEPCNSLYKFNYDTATINMTENLLFHNKFERMVSFDERKCFLIDFGLCWSTLNYNRLNQNKIKNSQVMHAIIFLLSFIFRKLLSWWHQRVWKQPFSKMILAVRQWIIF